MGLTACIVLLSLLLYSPIFSQQKNIITSVDGNVDRSYINNFVDNEFLSIDSLEFRKHMATVTPDINMTTKIMVDGEETEVTIPVTVRFFWPSTGI